jgi:hypothetical protein
MVAAKHFEVSVFWTHMIKPTVLTKNMTKAGI